jgi:hypothetical protein
MFMKMIAAAANAAGLRVFFGLLLFLLLCAGFYMLRNRNKFFGHTAADPTDSYASANLRMWLVILVWLHAVVITSLMMFEV